MTRLRRSVSLGLLAAFLGGTLSVQGAPSLVTPGASFQPIVGEYQFTEGGAVDTEGNVYFSDIPQSRVYRWRSSDGSVQLFSAQLNRPNGLSFSPRGDLVVCESGARRIVTVTTNGTIQDSASVLEGLRFNSPNDLWIDPYGGVYFTDPRYGQHRADMQFDGEFVFYFRPGNSKAIIVDGELTRPNGIMGSPDGKTLYVADPGANKTYAYQITKNGSLSKRRLLIEKGSDGMTVDVQGNLYLTADDSVWIYDATGALLERLTLPDGDRPTNVCFGGADRTTLFVTARKVAYTLPMQIAGAAVN
jgi:gluconolactonase